MQVRIRYRGVMGRYVGVGSNSIFAKLWGIRQTQQHQSSPTCSSQTTTKQITPHQTSSMNQCIFSSLSCFIACMQGCHSIHQMANLTNVAKYGIWPHPNYRPITPRYIIRFSSFKILWHDNMLTHAHTKYWINPITSYYIILKKMSTQELLWPGLCSKYDYVPVFNICLLLLYYVAMVPRS